MSDVIFNSFKKKIMDTAYILSGDVKVKLVTSAYTPNQDSHVFASDVTNEVSGTGYVSGGAALSAKTYTQDNTDNEGVFDAADLSWTGSTITAKGAVIYKNTGNASTSPLFCYIDFGSNKSSVAGTFTISWNSEGILNIN